MDGESNQLTWDELGTWTVKSLKDYLRIRGLKTTGKKAELIALVYSASQLGVQEKPDEVEEDRTRSYRELLNINKSLLDLLTNFYIYG